MLVTGCLPSPGGLEYWSSGVMDWLAMLDTWYSILDTGLRSFGVSTRQAGCWMVRFWILDSGFWN